MDSDIYTVMFDQIVSVTPLTSTLLPEWIWWIGKTICVKMAILKVTKKKILAACYRIPFFFDADFLPLPLDFLNLKIADFSFGGLAVIGFKLSAKTSGKLSAMIPDHDR